MKTGKNVSLREIRFNERGKYFSGKKPADAIPFVPCFNSSFVRDSERFLHCINHAVKV